MPISGRPQEAGTYENTRAKAQAVRMQVVKQAQVSKHAFLQEYEERLSAATARAQKGQDEDAARKRHMAATQRQRQKAHSLH